MPKSATALARKLLKRNENGLEELRLHMFELDGDEHDEELEEKLYAEFFDEFDRVQSELTTVFGTPVRSGTEDDDAIPLNGVFRVVIWQVEEKGLFVAAAHEDRGLPIILMLGTVAVDQT